MYGKQISFYSKSETIVTVGRLEDKWAVKLVTTVRLCFLLLSHVALFPPVSLLLLVLLSFTLCAVTIILLGQQVSHTNTNGW